MNNLILLYTTLMAKKNDPFDINVLRQCKGYDPLFIDSTTNISIDTILNLNHKSMLPEVDGNDKSLLNYSMLSIWYNKERKVPFVAAYNIDKSDKEARVVRKQFKSDPRIAETFQLGKAFFDLVKGKETEFEIGHMASHQEMSWGINSKVQSNQTFHFTNSVPQVEKLNSGLWSKLESYIVDEVPEADNKRIAVFTGPMLHDNDPEYLHDKTFQIPLFFYKIVLFSHKGKLHATAFVMSQLKRITELKLIEPFVFTGIKAFRAEPSPFSDYKHREIFQVNIDLIEDYTGLNFNWENINRIKISGGSHKLKKIAQTGGKDPLKSVGFVPQKQRKTNIILPE